eukprot:scaffold634745_cov37-Prasinocladus_malaysianus.AAC.1
MELRTAQMTRFGNRALGAMGAVGKGPAPHPYLPNSHPGEGIHKNGEVWRGMTCTHGIRPMSPIFTWVICLAAGTETKACRPYIA